MTVIYIIWPNKVEPIVVSEYRIVKDYWIEFTSDLGTKYKTALSNVVIKELKK